VTASVAVAAPALTVSEIFLSLQGESTRVGLPSVFVRLTGCPLRCTWCDTEYAFAGGRKMTVPEVLAEVAGYAVGHVCVTGGEPLAQRACRELLHELADAGLSVSLETSGALDIAGVDPRVSRIVDLKAPGSGECERNRWQNLEHLTAEDEIKFVVRDRLDYDWARRQIAERRLATICPVLLSPVAGELAPATLAGWIVDDRLPVRFQLQLHKILWGDARSR
jgi:7-carboxy-7-deazaguanine synthase